MIGEKAPLDLAAHVSKLQEARPHRAASSHWRRPRGRSVTAAKEPLLAAAVRTLATGRSRLCCQVKKTSAFASRRDYRLEPQCADIGDRMPGIPWAASFRPPRHRESAPVAIRNVDLTLLQTREGMLVQCASHRCSVQRLLALGLRHEEGCDRVNPRNQIPLLLGLA